jgi:hypothetical protein
VAGSGTIPAAAVIVTVAESDVTYGLVKWSKMMPE